MLVGKAESVLLIKVSGVLIEGCPDYRGVLIEGFHSMR